jgi:hypothetical protein
LPAELVRLRTPVMATMQLRHYDTFYPRTTDARTQDPIGPQSSGTGARVLKQTEPWHLRRRWSSDERVRARDCDDLRIIDTLTHHGPYGVAGYLAVGPALLTEWRHARPGGHPRGAALVSAAVDQALSPDAPQDLADLEAAAESYGYGCHGQAPTRVLADLVTDFTALCPLLAVRSPPRSGPGGAVRPGRWPG